jgi:RNA polymerase-binding transcription factor DksA
VLAESGTGSVPAGHEQRLRLIREEAIATIAALDGQIDAITRARTADNSDDEHDPEGATIAFERSQADALRTAAVRRIAEVDAALVRFRAGLAAVCAVGGEPIPEQRLIARPTATTCVRHA